MNDKFTKNLLLTDQNLANEFIMKFRERKAEKELTKHGFTKYVYERSADRSQRVHDVNKELYLSLKETYKENPKLKLRDRIKNRDIQEPFKHKTRNENERLGSLER